MATTKKLLQAAAGNAGGAGLNVENVFSSHLHTGDYNTGTLNKHIKNNVPLSNFGTGGTSVNFSGNQYLTRSDFSGNSDGKELTFSAWILFNDFEDNFVFSSDPNGGGSGVNVGYRTGKLRFEAYNSAGSIVSQWHVDDTNTPFHQWFHLCFSVNTASGTAATKVYINDVAATKESVTSSNQNIDRTRTVQRLAARATDYKLTGNLAHVFMDYTYRNLDTESNRRLFIDANGGSTDPSTLSALNPIMYCPLTDDYTMGKNLGTGGDFTSSGGPSFSTLGTEATADTSEGGMVWIKNRSSTDSHMLFDTERGASKSLSSNETTAQVTNNPDTLTQFLADGFFLGDDVAVNTNSEDYASWTFLKSKRFFDIVTWTGDGNANKEIAHNLGSTPGVIIIKNLSGAGNWLVYHRSSTNDLNLNNSNQGFFSIITSVTSTSFNFSSFSSLVNANGSNYVAYLFAHNDGDGDFGPDADADIIKCGSFVPSSTWQSVINIGFEPQWIMYKKATGTGDWNIVDSMRGIITGSADPNLSANTSDAEVNYIDSFNLHANGFEQTFSSVDNDTYIYIAIRRGPMAVPTDATEVFAPNYYGTSGYVGYLGAPADMSMLGYRNGGSQNAVIRTRMLPNDKGLVTSSNSAEITTSSSWDNMSGVSPVGTTLTTLISWTWKRASGYMDCVAYFGNGTAGRTVSHNLGVAPEMMIVKVRSIVEPWVVYHKGLNGGVTPQNYHIRLTNGAEAADSDIWNNTAPTSSVFTTGGNDKVNANNQTYIAYLFASLDGISKVGSYTGTGSDIDVDCGFTSGARFVLIKRADASSTGWGLIDTVRGLTSSTDAYLFLNLTDAEGTSDILNPLSSGFKVVSTGSDWNASGGSYIFYAIA